MIDLNAPLDVDAIKAARSFGAGLPTIAGGLVTHVSIHWSATPFGWALTRQAAGTPIPYNAVADIDDKGNVILVPGMDPLKNARDIPGDAVMDVDYCASCYHRNSHGLAVSAACLGDTQTPSRVGPAFFGPFAPTQRQVDFMLAGGAAIGSKYGLQALDANMFFTHAEAAIRDSYFLGEDPDCRWDFATLEQTNMSVAELKVNAVTIGNAMRRRIRLYKLAL